MPPQREQAPLIRLDLAIVILALATVTLLSSIFQQQVSFNKGAGWDGVHYCAMAGHLAHHGRPGGPPPLVYRIGTPLLASLVLPNNLILGMKLVNLVAAVLASLLLLVWLRFYIADWRIRTLLCLLFITQWHGPTRFVFWYPTYVDPWAHVALLVGLIGIHLYKQGSRIALPLVSVDTLIGVAFREIVLIIPIALALSVSPLASFFSRPVRERITLLIPLLCGIAGLTFVHLIVVPTDGYSFFWTAVEWGFRHSIAEVARGWLIAFGPVLVLAVYNWEKSIGFLVEHKFQLVFLCGMALLACTGGSDTERFAYWSMPVTYVLIGKAVADNWSILRSPSLIGALAISQGLSQRLLWTIPDYPSSAPSRTPLLTSIGDVPALDLTSFHAAGDVMRTSFAQYVCVCLGLLVWLNLRAAFERRRCKEPSASAIGHNQGATSG
jgi:hypothetical protein